MEREVKEERNKAQDLQMKVSQLERDCNGQRHKIQGLETQNETLDNVLEKEKARREHETKELRRLLENEQEKALLAAREAERAVT